MYSIYTDFYNKYIKNTANNIDIDDVVDNILKLDGTCDLYMFTCISSKYPCIYKELALRLPWYNVNTFSNKYPDLYSLICERNINILKTYAFHINIHNITNFNKYYNRNPYIIDLEMDNIYFILKNLFNTSIYNNYLKYVLIKYALLTNNNYLFITYKNDGIYAYDPHIVIDKIEDVVNIIIHKFKYMDNYIKDFINELLITYMNYTVLNIKIVKTVLKEYLKLVNINSDAKFISIFNYNNKFKKYKRIDIFCDMYIRPLFSDDFRHVNIKIHTLYLNLASNYKYILNYNLRNCYLYTCLDKKDLRKIIKLLNLARIQDNEFNIIEKYNSLYNELCNNIYICK